VTHFRVVTAAFSVSPQIGLDDVALARADGFRLIVNNRPDGEEPGQPTSAEIEEAARVADLAYVHIPVVGRPTRQQVEAMHAAIVAAEGPALAYCRSGNRSILTWALGRLGTVSRAEIVRLATGAGYNLSGVLPI
jgi:uncharacterized protein (TIGR01244 family)